MNRPLDRLDPSGDSPIIIGGVIVLICGKVAICHWHKTRWDRRYGARQPTRAERNCLRTAYRYLPGPIKRGSVARCMQNLSMANSIPNPITMCHKGCQMPPVNQGVHTYLAGVDVDCTSCFSTLNLMMTLVHECWHQRLGCPGEVETYQYAINVFKNLMKRQCAAMARGGVCNSKTECKQAIDAIIENDEGQLRVEKRRARALAR